ncbi:MAG: hypothetical protein CMI57_02975 [Parcubacteria group bacterium]|nr:hypothetical protein [Parcubacteria group bacterium]
MKNILVIIVVMLFIVPVSFSSNSFAEEKIDNKKEALVHLSEMSKELDFAPEDVPNNLTGAWLFMESKIVALLTIVEMVNIYETTMTITNDEAKKLRKGLNEMQLCLVEASEYFWEKREAMDNMANNK